MIDTIFLLDKNLLHNFFCRHDYKFFYSGRGGYPNRFKKLDAKIGFINFVYRYKNLYPKSFVKNGSKKWGYFGDFFDKKFMRFGIKFYR